MSNAPPPPPAQPVLSYQPYDLDTSHLNILSIFYFVFAGLQCLGVCLSLLYVVGGIVAFAVGMANSHHSDDAVVGVIMGGLFGCMGIVLLVLSVVTAVLNYLTGMALRQRKHLTLIYVVAALTCLSIPLGTVLGIFTFVVVSRPSIKASFDAVAASRGTAAAGTS